MNIRKYSLDFIKIVATSFIVLHHYQQFVGGIFVNGVNFYGGSFNFGLLVELFFILSGYFMWPYIRKIYRGEVSLKRFYLSRLARLLPMVIICAFAFQFLAMLYYNRMHMLEWFFPNTQLWDLLVAALGMQQGWVFKTSAYINYPVWYISVLLLCYLVMYVGVSLSQKLKISSRYFMLVMVAWGIIIQTYDLDGPFTNAYTARGFCAFFTGVLIASWFYDRSVNGKVVISALAVILLIIVLITICPAVLQNGLNYILTFILYPSLIIAFEGNLAKRIFSKPLWSFLADVMFHSFMWHSVIIIPILWCAKSKPNPDFWCSYRGMLFFYVIIICVGCISKIVYSGIRKKVLVVVEKKRNEVR